MKKLFFMRQLVYSHFRQISFIMLLLVCIIQTSNGQTNSIPNIIGNNMVLQQNTLAPIWGRATPGTSNLISASWGQSVTAITDASGKWMARIQTPVATPGQAPVYTLSVTNSNNTITYTNILVGEVWLCTGQSNMQFIMRSLGQPASNLQAQLGVVDYTNEIAAANYPNIRLFTVTLADSLAPARNCGGSWVPCTPANVTNFSAVAYYFGREIYNNAAVNVPVGLIVSAYGGTSICAWMKDSILRNDSELKVKYIDRDYTNLTVASKPSLIYNAMIAPLIPYAMKGVLWYQGETNTGDGPIYTKANLALIKSMRALWGTELSFYATQIAPYLASTATKDLEFHRAFFHEYQNNIQTLSKTGIAVTSDILLSPEERYYIHPRNKKLVGKRLAYWALAKDYAQPIQYIGPQYQSFAIEGAKIRITYKPESLGSGLVTNDGGTVVTNFKMAGADKKYYPATGIIDGNTVLVSSSYVTTPVAVRYAFTDGAMTNLMNKEGIPAYNFRTDIWSEWSPVIPYVDVPELTAVEKTTVEISKLYPNPFHDRINISGISQSVKKIEIIDIMGRKVKSQIGEFNSDTALDVSDIPKGVYILRIFQNDLTTSDFKAIKQ